MKTTATIFSILLLGYFAAFGQNSRPFSYQAVVRNNSGDVIANQTVNFRTTIHNYDPTGPILYRETHSVTTNQFGIVTLQIGNGSPVSGIFSDINWGDGVDKFLQTEVDITGGTSYTQMGTSQLLSVPYSLNSERTSGITVMSGSERDNIGNPSMGMQIFNSDTRRINYYDGYGWLEITGVKQAEFTCGNPLLDSRDGTYYNTVEIGSQCWMAENLNIGTMISGTTNPSDDGNIEKYCYANQYCDQYGGLYQWHEMMNYSYTEGGQGICPEGWHIPTNAEWTTLINVTGGTNNAGASLVQGGSSGFEALMGGLRINTLSGYAFAYVGNRAYFWTSSYVSSSNSYSWFLVSGDSHAYSEIHDNQFGYSVRCIKD